MSLDRVGTTVLKHYTNNEKLDKLLELGDLSRLGSELGEQHEFSNPFKFKSIEYNAWDNDHINSSTFYGRDRGEEGTMARQFSSYGQYAFSGQFEGYDYIFKADGKWYMKNGVTKRGLTEI